jgi:molybdopterin converting factor small subunit
VAAAQVDGTTVAEVLESAGTRFGVGFAEVAARSRVWIDGEAVDGATPVPPHATLHVIPPVSGG